VPVPLAAEKLERLAFDIAVYVDIGLLFTGPQKLVRLFADLDVKMELFSAPPESCFSAPPSLSAMTTSIGNLLNLFKRLARCSSAVTSSFLSLSLLTAYSSSEAETEA
jgi:hypothetical protein